jgi:ElaB/YqjD/DUF883 family membrane-anchored ribosome-binding protein
MAGAGDRGSNPQQGSHPRMGAGLPAGPGGPSRPEGQGGAGGTMEQMSSTVSEAVGQVRDKAREMASNLGERAGDAWESTSRGVRQGAQAVADSAQNFWAASTDLIRRYPVASVAIAFALGCLTPACLAACFGRGDDVARGMSRSSQY